MTKMMVTKVACDRCGSTDEVAEKNVFRPTGWALIRLHSDTSPSEGKLSDLCGRCHEMFLEFMAQRYTLNDYEGPGGVTSKRWQQYDARGHRTFSGYDLSGGVGGPR